MVAHSFLLPLLGSKQFYNLNEEKCLPNTVNLNMEEIWMFVFIRDYFLFQHFPSLHEAGEIEIFKILCLN